MTEAPANYGSGDSIPWLGYPGESPHRYFIKARWRYVDRCLETYDAPTKVERG